MITGLAELVNVFNRSVSRCGFFASRRNEKYTLSCDSECCRAGPSLMKYMLA